MPPWAIEELLARLVATVVGSAGGRPTTPTATRTALVG